MKVAVIGLGKIGFEFGLDNKRQQPASHFHCYEQLDKTQDIGICESDKEKLVLCSRALRASLSRIKSFTDYHQMLEEFQPEIVSICTPTPTHATITCKVASHPSVKAIFLEKPIAQNLSDADKIIETCKKHDVKLTVNHTRRWHRTWMLAQGQGLVTLIGIHHGPLLRTGIHMLDLFNWILEGKEPVVAQAFGAVFPNYITPFEYINDFTANEWAKQDFNISGCITYEDNILAILINGRQKSYLLFELDIIGEHTREHITHNGIRWESSSAYPSKRYSDIKELKKNFIHFERKENPLMSAIKEVVSLSDKYNSCTGEDARKALNVALALHFSAMNGNEQVPLSKVPKNYTVKSH